MAQPIPILVPEKRELLEPISDLEICILAVLFNNRPQPMTLAGMYIAGNCEGSMTSWALALTELERRGLVDGSFHGPFVSRLTQKGLMAIFSLVCAGKTDKFEIPVALPEGDKTSGSRTVTTEGCKGDEGGSGGQTGAPEKVRVFSHAPSLVAKHGGLDGLVERVETLVDRAEAYKQTDESWGDGDTRDEMYRNIAPGGFRQ